MIALNELLKEHNKFDEAYKKLGIKVNLEKIKSLQVEIKHIQLDAENKRATCNKLCSEIASLRRENKDTQAALEEILLLDNQINELQAKLDRLGKKINKKLRHMRNIPDEFILNDIVLAQNEDSKLFLSQFLGFVNSKFKTKQSSLNVNKVIMQDKNRLLTEEELPEIVLCNDAILCFMTDFEFDDVKNTFLSYFKEKSSKVTRIRSKKTSRACADEYLINLVDCKLKMEIVREFNTREYGIKYKNSSIDMTKFVNEIKFRIKK